MTLLTASWFVWLKKTSLRASPRFLPNS